MRSTADALGASMAILAQGQMSRMEVPPTSREMLDRVVSGGGATIVTEREAVLARREAPHAGLQIAAPATGAVFLGYPLAVTTQDPTRRAEVAGAAEALRDATASPAHRDGLSADGFRKADRAPLADGAGVGEIEMLVVRDPDLAELSGRTVIGAEIAQRYGLTDEDGRQPPSHRDMMGDPREPSSVVVR